MASTPAVAAPTSVRRPPLLGSGLGPLNMAIGGHRGMGENLLHPSTFESMRYRENTLSSFRESVKTGVTFVEFDVQVTSDGVPVLFHDDMIEWGDPADHHSAPISDLSLDQFKALCGHQVTTAVVRKTRGDNLTWQEQRAVWKCAVEDEMPTLAELFEGLPENVGFDLEVKMTTPSTAVTSDAELDRVLGPIIDTVARYAGDRPMVYSSFDPDICVELSKRQNTHKVLFLTHCHEAHCDFRRRSVVAAIDLATSNGFAGIVVDTEHLFQYPSLIEVVKAQGLYLASYGLRNNEEDWVEAQIAAGVDAVIADDVSRVVMRLR